jgi:hypothetical protein
MRLKPRSAETALASDKHVETVIARNPADEPAVEAVLAETDIVTRR